MLRIIAIIFIFLCSQSHAQDLQLVLIKTNTESSFRGLSVVDDKIAWVSGTKGSVGISKDGGNNWSFLQVNGFEKLDFRSIYAFDENTAIIANAGTPAAILLTQDGGKSWNKVYSNSDSSAFIDGIDFWNSQEGLVSGDPINGKMLLLYTKDGGKEWTEIYSAPKLSEGEASFAASGTTIRCFDKEKVFIATGGKISRLWFSENKGVDWKDIKTPILQGSGSTGIFSVLNLHPDTIFICGGDYHKDTLAKDHVFYSLNAGKSWTFPLIPTRGYRECIEKINDKTLIATGPTGTDISFDKGIHWKLFSDEKFFHVVRKARKGSLAIIAGGKGKIGIIKSN